VTPRSESTLPTGAKENIMSTITKRVGRINPFFEERNYGFIHTIDDSGRIVKVFLHGTNVVSGTPHTGLTATFQVIESTKGPIAVDVEVGGAA
jgi:cold shock CspA family protein